MDNKLKVARPKQSLALEAFPVGDIIDLTTSDDESVLPILTVVAPK